MTFNIRLNLFYLALFSLLLLSLSLYNAQVISINAQSSDQNSNKKEDKNDDDDITTIKTKINLNNIDIKNHDQLKLVSYLNGEGHTTYIDLKESKNKINIKDNSLTVDLQFNK
ncbi:MAG TPA: hypothetical protein VHJ38_01405, partial [Nitrososphaeraceae archaeon]|nr:hypothetical protein [Nitrososphaeraceae archaeon]